VQIAKCANRGPEFSAQPGDSEGCASFATVGDRNEAPMDTAVFCKLNLCVHYVAPNRSPVG